MAIHSPAGGGVYPGYSAKEFFKSDARFGYLAFDPGVLGLLDAFFPENAIPGVNAHLKTGASDLLHYFCAANTDVRAGKDASVEAGAQIVVARQRCGSRFASALIRAEREKKGCTRVVSLEEFDQRGNAVQGSLVSVDVNLERDTVH